jgi:hypothetical protein
LSAGCGSTLLPPLIHGVKRWDVGARHRFRRGERRPLALADQKGRARQRAELAGVIGMEVADADELHLLRPDLELRELLGERDLRRARIRSWLVAGVPDHDVLAVAMT